MLIFFFFFLGEINTLAAHSHSHTAKLAVTKDIKLSSSEVPLSNVFAAYKYIYALRVSLPKMPFWKWMQQG